MEELQAKIDVSLYKHPNDADVKGSTLWVEIES